ncbi:hypothetical protein Barb6_00051 [Bacteroidales bacterium Barb6]|nr:hypothetical protein Barb6_00051 [Bacteroidales bacterium Barb6]
MQEVLHGEVGKLETELADDTGLPPAGGEFHLIVCFGYEVVFNIHRSVFGVGYRVGIHVFRVKVTHLGKFADRADQLVAVEKRARLGAEFAAHNVFIEAVVPVDDDAVDGCLRAFLNTDFEGYGIVVHIRFHRVGVEKEVTVVEIYVGDGIVVGGDAFAQLLLVIDFAGLHV